MTGLRAVVVGAGFAGEGHTVALRENGVAVEAICARTPSAVQATAQRLGVPRASTDWRATIDEIHPEIVAVATPAGAHAEMSSTRWHGVTMSSATSRSRRAPARPASCTTWRWRPASSTPTPRPTATTRASSGWPS